MDLVTTAERPPRHRPRRRARRVRRPRIRPALRRTALRHRRGRRDRSPKQEPADSFILHAPLELLARRALLRDRSSRSARRGAGTDALGRGDLRARRRIDRARADADFESPAAAASALVAAIEQQGPRRDRPRRVLARPSRGDRRGHDPRRPVGRQPRGGRPRRASTSRSSPAPPRAAVRRSDCYGRSCARSRGSPSSASNGSGRVGDRTEHRQRRRRQPRVRAARSRQRRASVFPGATSSSPPCTRSTTAASRDDVIAPTLPANFGAAGAAIMRVADARRCSRTIRRSRRTAGRTASRCRKRVLNIRPWLSDARRARRRSRRRTSSRSAPRKAPATSTSTGGRRRPRRARATRSTPIPSTAASAVFHADDERARGDRSRARRARRRATTTRISRSTRTRASRPASPTRPNAASTSRPRPTSARGGAERVAGAGSGRALLGSSRSLSDTSANTGQAAGDAELGHVFRRLDRALHRALGHERVRQVLQHDHSGEQREQRSRTRPRGAARSRTRPSIRR